MRDAATHGRLHCRQCLPKCADGFSAVEWAAGVGFKDALKLVADHLHIGNGHTPGPANAKPKSRKDSAADAPLAPVETRDAAFRALFEALELAADHRDALRARGLTDEAIDAAGYRTLDGDRRTAIEKMKRAAGVAWSSVPGVAAVDKMGRGILIPCRDIAGRNIGVRVRLDDPGEGGRYRFLSTGSPRHPLTPHVSALAGDGEVETVRLTEGELKADVATLLSGVLTLSFPGVGSWRSVLDPLRELGARRVLLAFDADAVKNHAVAKAQAEAFDELPAKGFDVVVERWDATSKGIDDALAAGLKIEVLEGGEALEHVEACCRSAGVASPAKPVNGHRIDEAHDAKDKPKRKPKKPVESYRPFPVEALPDAMRRFVVSTADSMNCDPSFVALPLLAAFGATIGNARVLAVSHKWRVPPILWVAVCAESGSVQTPAIEAALKPFRDADDTMEERFAEAWKVYQDGLDEWKRQKDGDATRFPKPEPPAHVALMLDDVTCDAAINRLYESPRGMLLVKDELAAFLGNLDRYGGKSSRGGSESARWLNMYNAQRIKIDRKSQFPPTLVVRRASLCIVGGVQPGILRDLMGRENRANGMLARWIVTYPPPRVKTWPGDRTVDFMAEVAVKNAVDGILSAIQPGQDEFGRAIPLPVELSREALAEYRAYYRSHNETHAQLSGDEAAISSKQEETPLRLALILHHVRLALEETADETAVDVDTMRAAITITAWLKTQASRVLGVLGEDDEDQGRRKLAEWIEARGGQATSRDLVRGLRAYRGDHEGAVAALRDMEDHGYGTYRHRGSGDRGGQPTMVFVLSRSVDVDGTPITPAISRVVSTSTPNEGSQSDDFDDLGGESDVPQDPDPTTPWDDVRYTPS